jgi:hypothetical protein
MHQFRTAGPGSGSPARFAPVPGSPRDEGEPTSSNCPTSAGHRLGEQCDDDEINPLPPDCPIDKITNPLLLTLP